VYSRRKPYSRLSPLAHSRSLLFGHGTPRFGEPAAVQPVAKAQNFGCHRLLVC